MKGWFRAYFADILILGSIFRHLLKKSIKFLWLDLILALKLVIFGK